MTKSGGTQELQPQDGPLDPNQLERYGDYELLKPLTSGGMADIFLARKLGVQGFQKLVVIKRIRRELVKEQGLIDMFIDEAHVASKLDHPNVVVITDLGEMEDSFFMAMEYLRGQTLRELQKRIMDLGKMVPAAFWVKIMEYALDGLHYAHELRTDDGQPMNLVHRDFTPSNIMITYSGTVKVIDFGVARVQDNSQRHETRIGSIKGKISYLSPEQCMATPIDRRSDVFAAGIVLWELLSRRRLFDGPSDAAIIVSIMKDDIPLPGWQGQPVDWDLQDIIMKALQRDPNHRYQSVAAMRADLREYLRNKGEKVDSADISVVMNQLFEQERISDEKLAAAGRDPSKATPLPRDRSRSGQSQPGSQPGSRSGQSRSGQSRSGAGTQGSARGEQVVVPPPKSKTPLIVIGGGVVAALLGVGVWKFTRPPVEQPKPPEQVYNHPPELPKQPDPPPKQPDPPKQVDPPKQPETVAQVPEQPKAPDQPKVDPKHHHDPKDTAPTGGYGMLDFDTRPYTQVFIGKKKIGDTPLLGAKVPAGNIKLTLINEEAGVHEVYEITIPKDGHVSKKLKL